MKLNRARALMLVSTLAAVGCVVNQTDGDDEGSGGEPANEGGSSGTGGSAGKGGAAGKGGSSGSAGEASAGETSASGAPGAGGDGAAGASAGAAGEGVGGEGSGGDAAGGGGASGDGAGGDGVGGETAAGAGGVGSCDDSVGTGVTCETLDTTGYGVAEFIEGECTDAEVYLKPKLSDDMRTCMLAVDSTAACDATDTYACLNNALLGSCPDPTATAFCAEIATQCGGNVPENCETYVSGLTSEGRAQFTACVADEWCDLYICVESLGSY
jgi:hypothetical protein